MVGRRSFPYIVEVGYAEQATTTDGARSWVCLRPLGRGAARGWVLPSSSTLDLRRVSARLSTCIAGGSDVRLAARADGLEVDDRQERRGVYLPLLGPTELRVDDEILVGRTLIRVVSATAPEDQTVADAPSSERDAIASTLQVRLLIQSMFSGPSTVVDVEASEIVIGADDGDVVVGDDPDMSGVHVRLVASPNGLVAVDLDSREGTFRRARHGEVIPLGHPMVVDESLLTSERFDALGLAAQSAA